MAAYIPVPRDLTRVKTKVFFNLTKRQLICFGAGALMGVPSFLFSRSAFGEGFIGNKFLLTLDDTEAGLQKRMRFPPLVCADQVN